MAIYVGNASNSKKKISSLYVGKSGSKKEVSKAYTNKSGTVTQVFSKKGQQIFTESGTFTVPAGVGAVDIFLVGGGGQGGSSSHWYIGSGGGGGYTITVKSVAVIPGTKFSIAVGAGGIAGSNSGGGSSAALGYSASGGSFGRGYRTTANGSCGGSGGGFEGTYDTGYYGGKGGSNGSNGYIARHITYSVEYNIISKDANIGCLGQGSTTRAFGESSGTLYAGGGGGGARVDGKWGYGPGGDGGGGNGADINYSNGSDEVCPGSGTPNTGGGGGGGTSLSGSNKAIQEGSGGSGIVIIRWGY